MQQRPRVAVSIPGTVLEEKDSLRDRTFKVGVIARACAIYGVEVIEVFREEGARREAAEVRRLLEYVETPQYLRKRLYPIDESLRFAGILPPLSIPSHKAKVRLGDVRPGDVREGVVNGDGTVDVGLEVHPRLRSAPRPGSRVTAKIVSLDPFEAEPVPRGSAGRYWGYRVEERTPAEVVGDARFKVKVATSRIGVPLDRAVGPLRDALSGGGGVKLIFGSPRKGLFDIYGKELPSLVDFVVNLYPEQQVETVRTEEAVFAGLGLVSFVSADKA